MASPAFARDVAPGGEELGKVVQGEGEAFIKQGRSDGLSIAVVRDGKTTFYNFGTVSREKPAVPTEHTVYEIASVTKTFGSLLLAQAIVEDKARSEDDVRKYLPGDYPALQKDGRPVRLIDLVTTTSGLPDNLPDFSAIAKGTDPSLLPFKLMQTLSGYSTDALLKDLHEVTPTTVPGTERRHSNVAAELVGVTVARLDGGTFEKALSRRIEQPLGMQSGVAPARQSLLAVGYDNAGRVMPNFNAPFALAAGGLRYSAADMARYVGAQLKTTDSAIALTHQVAWGTPGERAMGYSWSIGATVDGEPRLYQTGGTFGYSSAVVLYPESHYGIVLLSNRGDGITQGELMAMSDRIMRRVWGESPALTMLKAQLKERSYAQLDAAMAETKKRYPRMQLSEDDVNMGGYALLHDGHASDAIAMFTFNTRQHPASANAYDSLGEAQRASGDKTASIASYRRALALNPGSDNARKMLAELGAVAE